MWLKKELLVCRSGVRIGNKVSSNDVAMPEGCNVVPDAMPRAADFESLVMKSITNYKFSRSLEGICLSSRSSLP